MAENSERIFRLQFRKVVMSGPVDMNDFMSGYDASISKMTRDRWVSGSHLLFKAFVMLVNLPPHVLNIAPHLQNFILPVHRFAA